ncbi:MAG: hypothetical protein WEC59_07850 [Salibacteraceae bacterium]
MEKWSKISSSTLWFLILGTLMSCEKPKEPESIDFGYDYLPLEIGNWIEYEVDSIVFNEFTNSTDTFKFKLRESCEQIITDLEGRTVYRFERSKRSLDSSDYIFQYSYVVLIDELRAEKVVDNIKTTILTFPPNEESEWDANAFNAMPEHSFYFKDVGDPFFVDELLFNETLLVIQDDDTTNFIFKSFSQERYAKDVGLIFKEYFDIETQLEIDSGLHWIQKLSDYKR